MDNAAVAGLTITTAVAAMDIFGKVLPAPHAVAGQPNTVANIQKVHAQCVSVAPLALGLGVGASLLAKSPWPAVGVLVAMAWMLWQYDCAARATGTPGPTVAPVAPGRYA
jgi:hypothetical protein